LRTWNLPGNGASAASYVPLCFSKVIVDFEVCKLSNHHGWEEGGEDLPPSVMSKKTMGSPSPGLGTGIGFAAMSQAKASMEQVDVRVVDVVVL